MEEGLNPAEKLALAQERFLEAVEGISEEELAAIDWPAICELMAEARRNNARMDAARRAGEDL